jgi:DNA modification methylase
MTDPTPHVPDELRPVYEDEYATVYLGDARDIIRSLSYDVIVTDPPYGMALSSGRPRAAVNAEMGDLSIANDHDHTVRDEVLAMSRFVPKLVFGRWSVPRPPGTRMVLTWEKGEHVGMGDLSLPWKPNTEEIYVINKGFVGTRTTSVLRHLAVAGCVGTANTGHRHHPTEKPVELMRELIAKCPPGVILDPFMGSGTTLRAAKDLGRKAIGIELEERYVEAAIRRLGQEVLAL